MSNYRVLFIFLDGVGLGSDNPIVNPLAEASMPNLQKLLGGQKMVSFSAPYEGERATLRAIDANLGVDGLPQSATGQAVLLTGVNIPEKLGYHYGPKPNPETAAFLEDGAIFGAVTRAGKRAALLNAYPQGYFDGIDSGKRLYSSIPLAVTKAGLKLMTIPDMAAERAISADFTGEGLRERLKQADIPTITPEQAGTRLAALAKEYDFSFFEYWLSDYVGHAQELDGGVRLMEQIDQVLGGLLAAWDDSQGVILLTADHGNLEDISTRKHTDNPVPLLLIGDEKIRHLFDGVTDLAGVAPAILKVIGV